MNIVKSIPALGLILGLSACAELQQAPPYDAPTRAATPDESLLPAEPAMPDFRVRNIVVDVPRSLKVNERNSYRPDGDIVWHGDPIGDRREQVRKILYDAFSKGVSGLRGDVPIDLKVDLVMFHALSPKARYSVGGIHEIRFYLTLIDARTGQPLGEPRFVKADLDALGGLAAIAAEEQGLTQKVRIMQHLARVIEVELTDPDGFRSDANLMLSVLGNL